MPIRNLSKDKTFFIFPHDLYENKKTNAGIKLSCKTSKKTIKNKNGEQENGELENAKKIW